MLCLDRARACGSLDLAEVWFPGSPVGFGDPVCPVVPVPERGQEVQLRRLRTAVEGCDLHQNVFWTGFCVLHEDVEIAVIVEYPSVEELVLHLVPGALFARLYEIAVRKSGLRVVVEVLHVRVRRYAV